MDRNEFYEQMRKKIEENLPESILAEGELVIKPACGPRAIPQIMTIPTIGLNCGNIINAAREATAIAHITAISTISLVLGLRLSKLSQNAATAHNKTIILVR